MFGLASSGLGFLIACIMIIQRQFWGIAMGDRPLLLFAFLLLFMGVQFITIGLLAELQARTYHESQDKPIYYVQQVLRAEQAG
jgi:hypothetical protein